MLSGLIVVDVHEVQTDGKTERGDAKLDQHRARCPFRAWEKACGSPEHEKGE